MSRGYLHLLDRALARTEHDAEVIPLARSTVATLRDDLAELDAARAEIERLHQVRAAAENALAHTDGQRDGYVPVQAEYVEALQQCVHAAWGWDADR